MATMYDTLFEQHKKLALEHGDLKRHHDSALQVVTAQANRIAELEAYGAIRDRVIETAIDSKYPVQVLYTLYGMLADGSLPDVCTTCDGIGWIRTGEDTEDVCNLCNGSGTSQETDLYSEDETVYRMLASKVSLLNESE